MNATPLFPLPELTDAQRAVLAYLARRRRKVAVVELAGELDITPRKARGILQHLGDRKFVERDDERMGRWGRLGWSATSSGRKHSRALAQADALIAPLIEHLGLTRRQAQVLYTLVLAGAPLTMPQITARYLMCGIDTVRKAIDHLDRLGLCYAVATRTDYAPSNVGYVANDAARALIDPALS